MHVLMTDSITRVRSAASVSVAINGAYRYANLSGAFSLYPVRLWTTCLSETAYQFEAS